MQFIQLLPLGIVAVTGSYDVSGWNAAIGIFVHKDNPIAKLTLKQVDGIFRVERSGAWKDLVWDESLARGAEKNLRKWGQLPSLDGGSGSRAVEEAGLTRT